MPAGLSLRITDGKLVPWTRHLLVEERAREVFEGWLEFASDRRVPGIAFCPEWPSGAKVEKVDLPCVRRWRREGREVHAYAVTALIWPVSEVRHCDGGWVDGVAHDFWVPVFEAPDGRTYPFALGERAIRGGDWHEQAG